MEMQIQHMMEDARMGKPQKGQGKVGGTDEI